MSNTVDAQSIATITTLSTSHYYGFIATHRRIVTGIERWDVERDVFEGTDSTCVLGRTLLEECRGSQRGAFEQCACESGSLKMLQVLVF